MEDDRTDVWAETGPAAGYAARVQTLPSTCGDRPSPNSKPSVPASIRLLVADLGLRYQPRAAADLEAHAGKLALLATDLADCDPALLDAAIQRWARSSVWMPRASELIDLVERSRPATTTVVRPVALPAPIETEEQRVERLEVAKLMRGLRLRLEAASAA